MGAGEGSHWSDLCQKCVWRGQPRNFSIKQLQSREKVHQLFCLFGCEYREGRAAAAPLLRPHDVDGRQGGHSAVDDVLPTYVAAKVDQPHDATRLPHKHSDIEIADLFPTIVAAPAPENAEDWDSGVECRHARYYASMPTFHS